VDEAAEAVAAADLADQRWFWPLRLRRLHLERTMRPLRVVAVDPDAQHAFEVAAVKVQSVNSMAPHRVNGRGPDTGGFISHVATILARRTTAEPARLPSAEEVGIANYLVGTFLSELNDFAASLVRVKGEPTTLEEYRERKTAADTVRSVGATRP
jgi:hypothetical protein